MGSAVKYLPDKHEDTPLVARRRAECDGIAAASARQRGP